MDNQKATQIIKDAPVDCEYSKLEILKIEGGGDMKYPAILKNKSQSHQQVVLAYNPYLALHIEGEFKGEVSSQYDASNTVNITHEYLANTYGEVVSPEHAEFIIELAKNAGLSVFTPASSVNHFIIKDGLSFHNCEKIKSTDLEQINIPLPPKQIQTATPEEFEMKQIMKNAGDNLVLGCEDSKCDEWPCLGDEVLVCSSARRLAEIKGKAVKVIGKCSHSDGSTIITVEHSSLGVFAVTEGPWIKKPKTPEEELRDNAIKDMSQSIRNKMPKINWDEAESISSDLYDIGYRKPQ